MSNGVVLPRHRKMLEKQGLRKIMKFELTDEIVELALDEWLLQNNIYHHSGPSYEESKGQMRKVLLKAIGGRLTPPNDDVSAFVSWLKQGPKLAAKCGLYVSIKVTEGRANGHE